MLRKLCMVYPNLEESLPVRPLKPKGKCMLIFYSCTIIFLSGRSLFLNMISLQVKKWFQNMLILVLGRVCRGREPASGQGDMRPGGSFPCGFPFLYLTSSEGTLPSNSSLCVPMSTIGLFHSLYFFFNFSLFPFFYFYSISKTVIWHLLWARHCSKSITKINPYLILSTKTLGQILILSKMQRG